MAKNMAKVLIQGFIAIIIATSLMPTIVSNISGMNLTGTDAIFWNLVGLMLGLVVFYGIAKDAGVV
jgi:hypothetical protein